MYLASGISTCTSEVIETRAAAVSLKLRRIVNEQLQPVVIPTTSSASSYGILVNGGKFSSIVQALGGGNPTSQQYATALAYAESIHQTGKGNEAQAAKYATALSSDIEWPPLD